MLGAKHKQAGAQKTKGRSDSSLMRLLARLVGKGNDNRQGNGESKNSTNEDGNGNKMVFDEATIAAIEKTRSPDYATRMASVRGLRGNIGALIEAAKGNQNEDIKAHVLREFSIAMATSEDCDRGILTYLAENSNNEGIRADAKAALKGKKK